MVKHVHQNDPWVLDLSSELDKVPVHLISIDCHGGCYCWRVWTKEISMVCYLSLDDCSGARMFVVENSFVDVQLAKNCWI